MTTRLLVTAGLPGSGKSAVAERLAATLGLPVLSVDPVEASLRRMGLPAQATGLAAYAVVEAIAEENLKLGLSVIVDAVNPVEAARAGWRTLAGRQGVTLTFVECVCSDQAVHRCRVERRRRGIEGLPEVTWGRVEARRAEYEPWLGADDRVVLDTAWAPLADIVQGLLANLAGR